MTSAELKDMIVGVPMSVEKVLFAHIGIGILEALENLREEMISKYPHDVREGDHIV